MAEQPKKAFHEHLCSMVGSAFFAFSLLAARDLIWSVGSSFGLPQSVSMLCVLIPFALLIAFRKNLARIAQARQAVRTVKLPATWFGEAFELAFIAMTVCEII